MAEYIERDKAYTLAKKVCNAVDSNPRVLLPHIILDLIDELPTADVRPVVRGKWNRTDAYPHRLYCSVCYKTYLKNDELLERWEFPLNFCPNCGADMREKS